MDKPSCNKFLLLSSTKDGKSYRFGAKWGWNCRVFQFWGVNFCFRNKSWVNKWVKWACKCQIIPNVSRRAVNCKHSEIDSQFLETRVHCGCVSITLTQWRVTQNVLDASGDAAPKERHHWSRACREKDPSRRSEEGGCDYCTEW